MIVAVSKETFPGESRVALVPSLVPTLVKAGLEVHVERGAGNAAGFVDAQYVERGAKIVEHRGDVFAADCVLAVRTLGANPAVGLADVELMRPGQAIIALADPLGHPAEAETLARRGVTLLALELMPRSTRAQSMDVLSSQATVAGYRAVLLAAIALKKLFPMMTTAAGTLTPAKVFIVGAGVAGLQAIASARRLGAVVSAYDVRPVVKEQVQSLGAKFIEFELAAGDSQTQGGYAKAMDEEFYRRQREMMKRVVAENDVVITTAAVPGRKAPTLVTREMIEAMSPGSVIVDAAAERGGNCELMRPDETVVTAGGVTILGPTNLASEVPNHASLMFAKNVVTFLTHLVKDGQLVLNTDDEITRETLVTRGGKVVHARVVEQLSGK
jgi:H+-translocating NAD(P) transhydrogenase subunit alpha